jgi:CRP-like cAMP-binding protein
MTIIIDDELRKDLTKKQACFKKLHEKEITILATLFKEKKYLAGETIVTEGDPVNSVYIIVEGIASVIHVRIDLEGHSYHEPVVTLYAGDSIGLSETGFYSLSGVRTATVIAKTDILLLELSMASFRGFALAYPHVNEIMRQQSSVV